MTDKAETTATVTPIRPEIKITKERLFSGDDPAVQRSNLLRTAEEIERKFSELGALEPTLDPLALVRLFGMSNSLRQNVDTMVTNVHGGGHRFEPLEDWTAVETATRIKSAMILEREAAAEADNVSAPDTDGAPVAEPTDAEVAERIEDLKKQAWKELEKARTFFDFCNPKMSFGRIRGKVGTDQEVTGFAAMEVRRNAKGEPKRLKHAPSWTMRGLPIGCPIKCDVRIRTTPITWGTEPDYVDFRRFVQIVDGLEVYFKEFGDPRVLSSKSGKFYCEHEETAENLAALKEAEPDARPATEILWFALDNPESEVYGLIRWAGNILSVLGSREMEEINLLFFDNKTIPPLVFMISGGHVAKEAKQELEEILRDHIKGSDNFHGCLVLEAEPAASAQVGATLPGQSQVKIDFKPLTDAIFKDQLWGDYDESNRHKVGQSFRIPPILRGDTKDFNRSTAEAALRYADDQVFGPVRLDFDETINRTLMPAIGVALWRFTSIPPKFADPAELIPLVIKLAEAVLRPEEAREFVEKALGVELPKIDAPWGRVPLKFALAGFTDEQSGAGDDPDGLGDEADDDGSAPDTDGQPGDVDDPAAKSAPVRVRVSAAKFDRLFGETGTEGE
jgi:PBSX family phage portal protein